MEFGDGIDNGQLSLVLQRIVNRAIENWLFSFRRIEDCKNILKGAPGFRLRAWDTVSRWTHLGVRRISFVSGRTTIRSISSRTPATRRVRSMANCRRKNVESSPRSVTVPSSTVTSIPHNSDRQDVRCRTTRCLRSSLLRGSTRSGSPIWGTKVIWSVSNRIT